MRHDQTDWLIHFVRDRNIDQDYPAYTEEEYEDLIGCELEPDARAFSVLLNIIKIGLKPYYSFRNDRTTIYGGKPAICVTEMPIYSFAQYVKNRNDTKKISSYGIAFLKSEFFDAGGRPVIYGTTGKVELEVDEYNERIIKESILPIGEQYRYVAYNPSKNTDRWIDWSHEREWRWRENNNPNATIVYEDYNSCMTESPGLPLFVDKKNGGFFSKIAIIVWSYKEADRIRKELTGYYLAQSNNYGIEFSKDVINDSFIIVLQEVIKEVEINKLINSQTIEGLQDARLIEPVVLHSNLQDYENTIKKALKLAAEAGENAAIEYQSGNHKEGVCGFSDICTYEVTAPEIQYMLAHNYASGPFDGKVYIRIHGSWSYSQDIDYKDFVTDHMCNSLEKSLSHIRFFTNSRLD